MRTDLQRLKARLYRAANKERINAKRRSEYHKIKDYMRTKINQYKKTEKGKENYKSQKIKLRYNLSKEGYYKLLSSQESKCAICDVHASKLNRRLVVDHNHTTGSIRGLLCSKCNSGIGMLQDDIKLVYKAADYLEMRAGTAPKR